MIRRAIIIVIGVLGLAIFGIVFGSLFEEVNKALSLTYSMILHLVLLISTVAMIYTSTYSTVKAELQTLASASVAKVEVKQQHEPSRLMQDGDDTSAPAQKTGNGATQEEVEADQRLTSKDE